MNRKQASPLAIFILLLAGTAYGQSPTLSLGRLFYTPEVRQQLESQRQRNLQESRSIEAGSLRLDGIVVRGGPGN